MTEKELLELAAKAAGKEIEWKKCASHIDDYELTGISGPWVNGLWWNPLTDDGDALRLAAKLELNIDQEPSHVHILVRTGNAYHNVHVNENITREISRISATRRAIVRAAAEIGRTT